MAIEFSDQDKVTGSWIKWDEIGKRVQGTLIGKRQKPDTYDATKMQWIYELLGEGEEITIVGGKPGIDMQMKHVRLGQIVELRYEGDKPTTTPGYDATKLIQVFTNKNAMDTEWLAQNPEMAIEGELPQGEVAVASNIAENNEGEIKVEDIPMDEPVAPAPVVAPAAVNPVAAGTTAPVQPQVGAVAPAETVNPLIAELEALGRMKIKVEVGVDVQKVIMETTGLAFIPSNFPELKNKLEAMPNI